MFVILDLIDINNKKAMTAATTAHMLYPAILQALQYKIQTTGTKHTQSNAPAGSMHHQPALPKSQMSPRTM
jgi:hypothetical protein